MAATDIDELAADIREVDGNHNLGAGQLAEALIEKGWRAPLSKAKYNTVGPADAADVGQLVRSAWSNTGAVWRVERVTNPRATWGRTDHKLWLVSLASNRRDSRWSRDMVIVVPTI